MSQKFKTTGQLTIIPLNLAPVIICTVELDGQQIYHGDSYVRGNNRYKLLVQKGGKPKIYKTIIPPNPNLKNFSLSDKAMVEALLAPLPPLIQEIYRCTIAGTKPIDELMLDATEYYPEYFSQILTTDNE